MAVDESRSEQAGTILVARDVRKEFAGLVALGGVDLTVHEGSITSIIGPNGAGKTTLLNAISGEGKPTSGSIWFRDTNITGWSPDRINGLGISRTFQAPRLFANLSCRENILVARYRRTHSSFAESLLALPRARRERRDDLERASELIAGLGIEAAADRSPGTLPYGDRRRLEIARALAADPELLLMDEPMAGMVHDEALDLAELVKSLRVQGLTIVLIEHNMNVVMTISDQVVVLRQGMLLASGTPAEVSGNPEVVTAYLGGERAG